MLSWIVPVFRLCPDLRARRGGARIVTFEANEVDHDVSRVVPAAVASARRAPRPRGEAGAPARALHAARARAPTPRYAPALPRPPRVSSTTASGARLSHSTRTLVRVNPHLLRASRRAVPAPARPRRAPDATDKNIRSIQTQTRRVSSPDPDAPPLPLPFSAARAPIRSLCSRASPSPRVPADSVAARASSRDGDEKLAELRPPIRRESRAFRSRRRRRRRARPRRRPLRRGRNSRRASRRPSARTTSSARRWRS